MADVFESTAVTFYSSPDGSLNFRNRTGGPDECFICMVPLGKIDMSGENCLLDLSDKNICPPCGKQIPAGQRVGSGQKSKGGFCSLDCYASFYQYELAERARRISDAIKRLGES